MNLRHVTYNPNNKRFICLPSSRVDGAALEVTVAIEHIERISANRVDTTHIGLVSGNSLIVDMAYDEVLKLL